jgi:hypothetical protein
MEVSRVSKLRIDGQSIIEYVVIFAIAVAGAVAILPKVKTIFTSYTTKATTVIQTGKNLSSTYVPQTKPPTTYPPVGGNINLPPGGNWNNLIPPQTPYVPTPAPLIQYTLPPPPGNNGAWIMAGETPEELDKLVARGIKVVYLQAGYFASDGTIHTDGFPSPEQLQTAVYNAQAAGLEIYPWVTTQSGYSSGVAELWNPDVRSTMLDQMVNFVQTYGFDGFQDDMEEPGVAEVSDYVTYFNAAEAAMQSIGKKYFISICANLPKDLGAELFSKIQVDRIQIMMYWRSLDGTIPMDHDTFVSWLTFTLANSSSPVNIAIRANTGGLYVDLTQSMAWVDEVLASGVSTAQLVGFDVFWPYQMDQTQWDAWNNWPTKNI